MGFNKAKRAAAERASEPKRDADGFRPSTKEDLKKYHKAGKKRLDERKARKEGRSKGKKLLAGQTKSAKYRELMEKHEHFEVLTENVFRSFEEFCKENGSKVPKYRSYLPRKEADTRFIFEVQECLARMTWIQLSKLISEAVNAPIVSKEFSEAFNFAAHVVLRLSLGMVEKSGNVKLADLSVLDHWPAVTLKRPDKEDRMSKKKREVEEELDEELEEEEEEEGEEDLDGDDEELDDEDSEESEDDEEEEEESEDDEEESEDEEEEESDESDEDEEDEEEEEQPARKRKEKTVKKTKTKKAKKSADAPVKTKRKAGKEKPAKAEKAEKKTRERKAPVEISTKSKFIKGKPRPGKGPKTKLQELLPVKGGMTMKELTAKAKEAGINTAKLPGWVKLMTKNGFIKVA